MKELIETLINQAITELKNQGEIPAELTHQVLIERCRDPKHGDFASNIALTLAKQTNRRPRELAQQIVDHITPSDIITQIEIAGPGFINFFIADDALLQVIEETLKAGDSYGQHSIGKGKRVHIEFVSANPTGPLHVGHGRSAAYGDCVARLLSAIGYEVHRDYYVNDAGRQMRILALSTWIRYCQSFNEALEMPANAYQGDYIIDIAQHIKEKYQDQFLKSISDINTAIPEKTPKEEKEKKLDALVEALVTLIGESSFEIFQQTALDSILDEIKEDLAEFDVTYDDWPRESQLIKEGLLKEGIKLLEEHKHLYKKDNANWFRATDFGDEKDRVLIRANGQPTYFASDVAYHLYKYNQGYDHIIDVFGADHHGYISRIRAFLKGLGKDPDKLKILLVQFAILYRGKEKVSMSTRSGQFVTLRELRHEVGNDAARFFYIMRKPEQHLDFDLELAKSESADNPIYYIQYAHARICSVWKQLDASEWSWNKKEGLTQLLVLKAGIEKNLMAALSRYPEIIFDAGTRFEPHVLATFLQELANLFHSYYNSSRFLVEEDELRNARLCLVSAIQQVLQNGLHLLGLSAPTEM